MGVIELIQLIGFTPMPRPNESATLQKDHLSTIPDFRAYRVCRVYSVYRVYIGFL